MRCCNVYNTKNIKLLKTRELHRLSRAKRNAKCCKDVINKNFLLANPYVARLLNRVTTEWE